MPSKKYTAKQFTAKKAAPKIRDLYTVTDTPVNGQEFAFLSLDPKGFRFDVVIPVPRVIARATAGSDESLDSQIVFSVQGDDDRGNAVRGVVMTDPRNPDELIVQELHITA